MPNQRCRVWAECVNCKKRFSINNAEYLKRMEKTHQTGLFCSKQCMNEYREKNKVARAMKARIIAINQKARGEA